jgi:hypothetical protein
MADFILKIKIKMEKIEKNKIKYIPFVLIKKKKEKK